MNITRNIRFCILATLCLNSLNALASEYRPRHSVPQYNNKAHSKGFFIFSPFIIFGKFANVSHFHMPQFGRLFENIDLSSGAHIIQEHKVMLSVAGALVVLSVLVKKLQKSDICGKWLSEKYTQVSQSVDDCANSCIQGCPPPVRLAITPIKIVIQFLCNTIKKCIAMNQKTIIFSIIAPVAGRILDGVCVCPIPIFNFTSIGGMASGCMLTKEYLDRNFEKVNERFDGIETKIGELDTKNIAQHTVTQEKIGVVQTTINTMGQSITQLFGKIKNLKTGVGQVKDQVGSVLKELVGIKDQVHLLHDKIDAQDKKTFEQYEKLTKRLEALEKLLYQKTERDEKLMLEVQEFKSTYQSDHKALREDLSTTSTHISRQITDVKREVKKGFASTQQALPGNDLKDIKIQALQLEAGQRSANNS